MSRQLTTLVLLTGLVAPAGAAADTKPQARTTSLKTTADELGDGMNSFNGMLVGRLAKKDVEKGIFIVNVDAVPRVWRNSKAKDPKSVIGKHVEVDGVFGKWLDVLLLVKRGETLEFEARHDGGNRLTFPGESLRKVAPVKQGDYPQLPEEFRGFDGLVNGRIVKKDADLMDLVIVVKEVKGTSPKNRAKRPNSVIGRRAMLGGFWQHKDAYHSLKVGDTLECELRHLQLQSDHLTVGEFRKVGKVGKAGNTNKKSANK